MDSSLNEEIDEGGELVEPSHGWAFECDNESSASHRVLIPMQLHLILVSVEMIDGISGTIERFHLWHSELGWKGEVEHLSREL